MDYIGIRATSTGWKQNPNSFNREIINANFYGTNIMKFEYLFIKNSFPKKLRHSSLKVLLLLAWAITSMGLFAGKAPQFKKDDVICFFGDSITHGGRYSFDVLDYYATRFPDRKITIHNCGISGDTAAGGLNRLQWDVIDRKPNATVIMFGMNDVRRNLYGLQKPNQKNQTSRKKAIDWHKAKMGKIAALLKNNNIQVIYVTPSPYDQTVKNKTKNLFGVNDALAECAGFCREQAAKNRSGLVDLHQPMTAINENKQKSNPEFSLIGRDRVHPHSAGHLVMAYLFLKSQQVPAIISSIDINYKEGKLLSQKNCTVRNIKHENGKLTFDCLEISLPMPVTPEYLKADKLVPLTRELNNEIMKVTGLPQGEYTLFIDNKKILSTDAATWGKGVNLALLNTPMQKQAIAIHALINRKRGAEGALRNLKKLEINMRKARIDINDPAARDKFLNDFLKKIQKSKYVRYYTSLVKSYRSNKNKEAKLLETTQKMDAEIYRKNKPIKHLFVLKPTP